MELVKTQQSTLSKWSCCPKTSPQILSAVAVFHRGKSAGFNVARVVNVRVLHFILATLLYEQVQRVIIMSDLGRASSKSVHAAFTTRRIYYWNTGDGNAGQTVAMWSSVLDERTVFLDASRSLHQFCFLWQVWTNTRVRSSQLKSDRCRNIFRQRKAHFRYAPLPSVFSKDQWI